MAFGLVGRKLVQVQQDPLHILDGQTSTDIWVSEVRQKVWDLQKKMWDHQIKFVPTDQTSMHSFEVEAMNRVIRWEHSVGRPASFNEFFRSSVNGILGKMQCQNVNGSAPCDVAETAVISNKASNLGPRHSDSYIHSKEQN